MAKLEAFEMPGYALEMYPNDHSPPHFHIMKDDWNVRIKFNLTVIRDELVWESKYPGTLSQCPLKGKEITQLVSLVKLHKSELNKQWQKLHPGNTKGKSNAGKR